ncbi:MAG: hypothetical protein ACK4GK_06215 [Ferrovibrio sp.]|jgi:hypothetical protein
MTALPYLDLVLAQMPRLLSRMDREPPSRTYGSFDRTHWGWKFTDFSGSRFQEALFALAWMYAGSSGDNPWRGSPLCLEWLRAGFRYWRGLQHADGSFDEAYPFERSLAATAFTGFYLGDALLRIAHDLPAEEYAATVEAIRHAGDWLCHNDEHHGVLSNHLAAAAAALAVAEKLTGEARFGRRSRYFVDRILARQSPEGWYEEYGGADFGYQTHGTFYLAYIWRSSQDERLLESLRRSVRFLAHFVHPNGTLGGEYGSRNTSFYFPAGFEILAPACPEAAAIAAFMRRSVSEQRAAGLAMMDAYNFCPLLNNYLFAHEVARELSDPPPLPFTIEGRVTFPLAGLCVHVTEGYQAVFAPSKGGVLKIYDKRRATLAYSDCGYWGEVGAGGRISSQSFCLENPTQFEKDCCSVRTSFAYVNQRIMTPWLFMAFRLFSLTVGRHKAVALKLKAILVKALVSRRRQYPATLDRGVVFRADSVTIEDRIDASGSAAAIKLHVGSKFSTIHMGSARYYQPDELEAIRIDGETAHQRSYTWVLQ